jgi:ABC-2 type transport system permease protein
MKEFLMLLLPFFWSVKNDLLRLKTSLYRKIVLYALSGIVFITLVTKLFNRGMMKLQALSPEVFNILLIKGFSLIFLIIFFAQIVNGVIISLNRFYQAQDLELLFTSPVRRPSLFFSRLFETHIKTSWMLVVFGIPLLITLGNQFSTNVAYYGFSLAVLILFLIIPVNIGVGITIIMAGMFSFRKIKRLIYSTGILAVLAIVTTLRIFRPERFANPELFANLKIFLSELSTPHFILLPNRWLSETLFQFFNRDYIEVILFTAILFVTSYLTFPILMHIYRRYHYKGWSILQTGGTAHPKKTRRLMGVFDGIERAARFLLPGFILKPFDAQSRALLRKDTQSQIHDTKAIQQNLILLSLIVVYLFSIASLPLNWEKYFIKLKYGISFFNLGLILVIVATLSAKLVYPVIVAEARTLWLIKTAPLRTGKYIWMKFLFLFVPVFLVGQILTVSSAILLNIESVFFMLMIFTTTLVCFSLVSMSVAFGVADLRVEMKDEESEKVKTGNVAFMMVSVVFILFILVLEIIPLYLYFLKESKQIVFIQKTWLLLIAVIVSLLVINIFVTVFSLRQSIRRFEGIQQA